MENRLAVTRVFGKDHNGNPYPSGYFVFISPDQQRITVFYLGDIDAVNLPKCQTFRVGDLVISSHYHVKTKVPIKAITDTGITIGQNVETLYGFLKHNAFYYMQKGTS